MAVLDKDKCLFQYPSSQSCRSIRIPLVQTTQEPKEYYWSSEWESPRADNGTNYWEYKVFEPLTSFPFTGLDEVRISNTHIKFKFKDCYSYFSALKLYPPGSQIVFDQPDLDKLYTSGFRDDEIQTGISKNCFYFYTEAYYKDNETGDGSYTISMPIEQFRLVRCEEFEDYGGSPYTNCDFCGATQSTYYPASRCEDYFPDGVTFEYEYELNQNTTIYQYYNYLYELWRSFRERILDVCANCSGFGPTEPNYEVCECTNIGLTDEMFNDNIIEGDDQDDLAIAGCYTFFMQNIRICRLSEPLRMT